MSKHHTFSSVKKYLQITFSPKDYLRVVWDAPRAGDLYAYQGDTRMETYWKKLPKYLVARCPFCGATYQALLDTHSLKYWRINPGNSISVFSYAHQEIGCRHFVAVQSFVNFNDHFYDEFNRLEMPIFVNDNGDIPFLSSKLLPATLPSTAVMHSLPICDLDRDQFIPRYSLYVFTYYAENPKAILENYQKNTPVGPDDHLQLLEVPDHMRRHPESADLRQWVTEGKLQWLDLHSTDLPLLADLPEAFPYGGITGYGYRFVYTPRPVIDTTPRWAFWRKRNLVASGRIELR